MHFFHVTDLLHMTAIEELDSHGRPPAYAKSLYKHYRQLKGYALSNDCSVIDLANPTDCNNKHGLHAAELVSSRRVQVASEGLFSSAGKSGRVEVDGDGTTAYQVDGLPGKLLFPPSHTTY